MRLQKFRWSKVYESSEEELLDFLQKRNITADRLHGETLTVRQLSASDKPATIWCAEGSFNLITPHNAFSFQPGDGMTLPAGTACELHAGISGYVYYFSA